MTTTVNEIDIRYEDAGPADAPAVIFIHGFPLNRSMWREQIDLLKGRYRAVAFDLRGHGESGMDDEPLSMELFVQDLLHFMDALRIDKAILCALSMGGYIALRAAETHPERFSALILCDTQCTADTPEAKKKRHAAIAAIRDEGVETFADASLGSLFSPGGIEKRPETAEAVRAMIVGTAEASLVRTLHALHDRDETCSKLPDLRLPVLVIVGEEDSITPPAAAHYLHENLTDASLAVIEDAGHLSNLENPAAFNEALEHFLASLQRRT